jgi:transketolase
MGDQIGVSVSGKLVYVPADECKRVLELDVNPVIRAQLFAEICRINSLYMIANAGSGHVGSSFSSLDIMSWIELNESVNPDDPNIFFSSKGHDSPGLYSTWIGNGRLDFDLIHGLRRIGKLPGHPDINTPGVAANTGSLGMGISKAKGMIFANKLAGKDGFVFVMTGDGELQEGQIWESLVSAANTNLSELIVIVDHNKLQSDTLVEQVSDLGDLERKFSSFGWRVLRCDGNDMQLFSDTLTEAKIHKNKPVVIIADTIKGKGVSFMEHTSIDSDVELYKFHSGAPTSDLYVAASEELIIKTNNLLSELGFEPLLMSSLERKSAPDIGEVEKLIGAYSQAIIAKAETRRDIVALDADLILDTGLIPFKEKFPDRFIECGIAEQDMVSQAGGLALSGLLPIVHSFSCFLSSRPNEQMYNNATENTKIIYVGSLAGLIPAGPGHSHQAVRDISSISAIPNMVMVAPSCEYEVTQVMDWAVEDAETSVYVRLYSAPIHNGYKKSKNAPLVVGHGEEAMVGDDIAIITYGPLMLSLACQAADALNKKTGKRIGVINLPWLNIVDSEWLKNITSKYHNLLSIDDHYSIGGQGQFLAARILKERCNHVNFAHHGLNDIPRCGTPEEVLHHHGYNPEQLSDYLITQFSDVL